MGGAASVNLYYREIKHINLLSAASQLHDDMQQLMLTSGINPVTHITERRAEFRDDPNKIINIVTHWRSYDAAIHDDRELMNWMEMMYKYMEDAYGSFLLHKPFGNMTTIKERMQRFRQIIQDNNNGIPRLQLFKPIDQRLGLIPQHQYRTNENEQLDWKHISEIVQGHNQRFKREGHTYLLLLFDPNEKQKPYYDSINNVIRVAQFKEILRHIAQTINEKGSPRYTGFVLMLKIHAVGMVIDTEERYIDIFDPNGKDLDVYANQTDGNYFQQFDEAMLEFALNEGFAPNGRYSTPMRQRIKKDCPGQCALYVLLFLSMRFSHMSIDDIIRRFNEDPINYETESSRILTEERTNYLSTTRKRRRRIAKPSKMKNIRTYSHRRPRPKTHMKRSR